MTFGAKTSWQRTCVVHAPRYDTTVGSTSYGYTFAMLVQNNEKVEESCMNDIANVPSGHGYTKDM